MRILIIAVIAFVAIGIVSGLTWPMENGTVQLSKISFAEITSFDTGTAGDLASVGATKGMLAFLEIGDEGKPIGNVTGKQPLRCGKGLA